MEIPRRDLTPRLQLGDERAAGGDDRLFEAVALFGVIDVDPAGQHPDRRPAAPHTAKVSVRVGADGAAADNGGAGTGQLVADVAGGA